MAFRLCDAESADDVDKAVFRLFWVEGAVQWQGVDGFVADVSHAESGGVGEEEGGVEFVDVVADEGVVPYESDEVREHLVYGRLVAQIGVGESIETCDLLGQRTLRVTSWLYRLTGRPFLTRMAPISTILSSLGENPVVSKSMEV